MEAAPDLKKSVVSSTAGTLLRIPFQMFCKKKRKKTYNQYLTLAFLLKQGHIIVNLKWHWKPNTRLKRISQQITCLNLLCHLLLIVSQLHTGALPRGEVFRGRNHLPVFKLQVLHQQLSTKHTWIKCSRYRQTACCVWTSSAAMQLTMNQGTEALPHSTFLLYFCLL